MNEQFAIEFFELINRMAEALAENNYIPNEKYYNLQVLAKTAFGQITNPKTRSIIRNLCSFNYDL